MAYFGVSLSVLLHFDAFSLSWFSNVALWFRLCHKRDLFVIVLCFLGILLVGLAGGKVELDLSVKGGKWKIQSELTPLANVAVTPENFLFLTR